MVSQEVRKGPRRQGKGLGRLTPRSTLCQEEGTNPREAQRLLK